jgi:hypothetical protein
MSCSDYNEFEIDACFWTRADRKKVIRDVKILSNYSLNEAEGSDHHPLQRAYIESQKMAWTMSRQKQIADYDVAVVGSTGTLNALTALRQWCDQDLRGLERFVRNMSDFHPQRQRDSYEVSIRQYVQRIVQSSRDGLNESSIASMSHRMTLPSKVFARFLALSDAELTSAIDSTELTA